MSVFALVIILSVAVLSVESEGLQLTDPNEPNNSRSTATPVQLPYNSDDLAINPSGDRDVFEFTLSETSQVEILVFADQVGSTLDPVMSLFNSDEELLNQSDDVVDLDPLIRGQLGAGTYFVVVEGFADLSVGFYQIEIFSQSLGDCIEAELETNETDSWSLGVLEPGTRIQVSLMGPADSDFDLALLEVISDAPPVVVAVDFSLTTTSQERVNYQVRGEDAREYLAQVNAFAGDGTYMLCLSIAPPRGESE